MDRLIDFLSPRGVLDWVAKVALFELVILALTAVAVLLIYPDPVPIMPHALLAGAIVSMPFVVLLHHLVRYQRRLELELARLAATDLLTGLPNRRAFRQAVAPEGRTLAEGTLLIFDADHFKQINDSFGHDVGDACLRAIGETLRRLVADAGTAARYGGEEFAVFLPGAVDSNLAHISQICASGIEIAEDSGGAALRVTLSAGAARAARGATFEHILSQADKALYRAKADGRARIAHADPPVRAAS